jgi:outer membrane protein insertion porin family
MHILRSFGLILLSSIFAILPIAAKSIENPKENPKTETAKAQQQLVESVDIQGNRRLRDEDLLYYIKTRAGDTFSPQQLERDLKELLSLNFFDKTSTKVLTEPGVRGGVNVIFEVKELPLIRDLRFEGAKAIQESDILKEFREKRVGISKEAIFDPVKSKNGVRILRELLAAKGFPNAEVTVETEEVSATSIAVIFNIKQGDRSRIIEIDFEGNEVFKDSELRNQLQLVKQTGLVSRFKGQDILEIRKLQYDLFKNVRSYMASKGYFEARFGEPQVVGLGRKKTSILPYIVLPLPLITSTDDTLKIIVPITEGRRYKVGKVKVEGNSIFSEDQIKALIGLKEGEWADRKRFEDALYEELKKYYGAQGFVEYTGEFDASYRPDANNPKEGSVDVTITIEEGKQFTLRRLEFAGNTFTRDFVLRREVLINEGDIYNQLGLENSVIRLNQTGFFDPIDKEKDVETRTDEENGTVDLLVKVKEKGRQQISFNGGVSGLSGTSFGLEYSTNNLLGRGENLSLQFGTGNRQSNFQFSYNNPYFRDRPISVGFSLFGSRAKFFGEGTFLSQNQDLFNSAQSPFGTVLTNSDNLFTQTTYGASLFATAPLSELFFKKRAFSTFSRLGLNYQLSATSIKDPAVNSAGNASTLIPVIFSQPSIITSRVTGSFVYDTRQPSANGIDTLKGTQLSLSFALAGLGGSVRTYQPSITYSSFIPIRKKRTSRAEVFGFRITAGTVGTFALTDKIKNANSLSFVNGIPVYERYYLGSEQDIRGYQVRSIGPITPVDTFVTSRNIQLSLTQSGAIRSPGYTNPELEALGTFTGASGANPGRISSDFRFVGGDTQILGNFEYRIPIFGPVGFAAFADIGSVFNLRKGGVQTINSNFLPDQPFLQGNDLSLIFLRNNVNFQASAFGGVAYDQSSRQLLTRVEYNRLCNASGSGGVGIGNRCLLLPGGILSGFLPEDYQQIFFRGEAQTNTRVRVNESQFSGIGDFRSSVGVELRVQVPIVNVPFRLIYFVNPNSKTGIYENVPNFFFQEKKRGFRFTVGRTF